MHSEGLVASLKAYKLYPLLFLAMIVPIYLVSNFYASTYPGYTSATLPRASPPSLSFLAINIFNGYTEEVSLNSTQAATDTTVHSYLVATTEDIFFAFLFLFIFDVLYNYKNSHGKKTKIKNYLHEPKSHMATAFFLSSIASQYSTVIILYFFKMYFTGISLFQVDSVITYGFFSVINTVLLIHAIRIWIKGKSVLITALSLFGGAIIACFFVLVLLADAIIQFPELLSGLAFMSVSLHMLGSAMFILIFSSLICLWARRRLAGSSTSVL